MLSDLQKLFNRPLFDVGGKLPEYEGIFSPHYKDEETDRFMTDYYNTIESAREQATRINLTKYYHRLIKEALKKTAMLARTKQKLCILDVGCGFGSATFPLLRIFPNSGIIASELSLPMLKVFQEKLLLKDRGRVDLLQLNAEELNFKENSLDLIVGAAVLHHLFYPEKTIKDVAEILKPGGIAIFFEPFEEGTSVMALIYQTIIYHGRFKWLDFTTKRYFRNMVALWDKMRNMDKGDDFFQTVDDKWLFQRKYFLNLAKKNNFESCQIYRIDKSEKPYTHLYESHLGLQAKKLPYWMKEVIANYEKWFSPDLKDELLTEGCIILKKKP